MSRQAKEMRLVYRDFLREANQTHPELVALEADLSSSMATSQLQEELGKRYVNVGIMEAEMVGVAAGLSIQGFRPYLHTFGPFASRRVFDQVFVSLGYAQLNATIIGSDAGVSAEMNGGTHMPFEDLGLYRLIPKSTLFEVSDDVQFEAVLQQTLTIDGLTYIRTTRKQPEPLYTGQEDFTKGYSLLREGKDLILVASGIMVAPCLRVAEKLSEKGLSVGVMDIFRIKPLSEELFSILQGCEIITVENHNRIGGLGSSLCELFASDSQTIIHRMGVDEQFGQVGHLNYLLKKYQLDEENIVNRALALLS